MMLVFGQPLTDEERDVLRTGSLAIYSIYYDIAWRVVENPDSDPGDVAEAQQYIMEYSEDVE